MPYAIPNRSQSEANRATGAHPVPAQPGLVLQRFKAAPSAAALQSCVQPQKKFPKRSLTCRASKLGFRALCSSHVGPRSSAALFLLPELPRRARGTACSRTRGFLSSCRPRKVCCSGRSPDRSAGTSWQCPWGADRPAAHGQLLLLSVSTGLLAGERARSSPAVRREDVQLTARFLRVGLPTLAQLIAAMERN